MNEEEFKATLKTRAQELLSEGRSTGEVQAWVDRQKTRYSQQVGKTAEPQVADAPAAPEDTASKLETPSSVSPEQAETERAGKEAAYRAAHSTLPGAASIVASLPDFLLEPYAAFESTLMGFGSGVADFATQQYARFDKAKYSVGPEGTLIKDEEQGKTVMDLLKESSPEDRAAIWENYNSAGDTIRDAVDASQFAEARGSGSISTELAEGNLANAAQLTANQTASGLASLVPFLVPGGQVLGPAVLGTATAGGEFEEDIATRPDATLDQIYNASYLKGGIELATEFVTAGIVGKARKLAGTGAAKEAVDLYTRAAWKSVLGDTLSEGVSEGLADLGSRAVNSAIYGDEWDNREAAVGFIDSAIVGAIVGGKVSTYGQIAKADMTPAQKEATLNKIAPTLRTEEQVQSDEARAKEYQENAKIIADTQVSKSLVEQAKKEAATRRNEEIEQEQKAEQKKRVDTLKDATATELKVVANGIDKTKKLNEALKGLDPNSDEAAVVQGEIDNHAQAVQQQLDIIESFPAVKQEQQRIEKEIEAKNLEIEQDNKFIQMEEAQAAKAEKPNPVGTAKRKARKKVNEQKLKENNQRKAEMEAEVNALRPTHADAKIKRPTVPTKTEAKEVTAEKQKRLRDKNLKASLDVVTDPEVPTGQKERHINDVLKSERGKILTEKVAGALKADPKFVQTALAERADRLSYDQLKTGKLDKELFGTIRQAVNRRAREEGRSAVVSDKVKRKNYATKEAFDAAKTQAAQDNAAKKEEIESIKELLDEGILNPIDYQNELDNIEARYGTPTSVGLEAKTEEGTFIAPEIEEAAIEQARVDPDEITKSIDKLFKGRQTKKVIDDYAKSPEELFAVVKSLPKQPRKGAYGGLFDSAKPPSLERFDAALGDNDVRINLAKYIDKNIGELYGLDSDTMEGDDIMAGAFDFLEGKKSDVKAFLPLLSKLKRNFPGTKIIISKQRMIEDFIAAGIDPGKADTVKGYTDGSTVVLNPDKLDGETPIHEYGHIWAQMTRQQRPDLYNKGAELIKKSAEWVELQEKIKDPDSVYYNMSHARAVEEAMATAIGKHGEEIFEAKEDQSQWETLRKQIWDWISNRVGIAKVNELTLDQFVKLAATEIVTGERFVKPKDTEIAQKSLIPDMLVVPSGTTRDYSPATPPIAEIDSHGTFKGSKLAAEVNGLIAKHKGELEAGGWIGYTTGRYGDAVRNQPKWNPQLNARIEAKVNGMRNALDKQGYTFIRDKRNPGFHIIRKKPSFLEGKYKSPKLDPETLRKIWDASRGNVQKSKKRYTRKDKHRKFNFLEADQKVSVGQIQNKIRKALKGKGSGDFKFSKVSAEVREILDATKLDLNRRGDQLSNLELITLDNLIDDTISQGKEYIDAVNQETSAKKEAVRKKVNSLVIESGGINPANVQGDAARIHNQGRNRFLENFYKGKIGTILAQTLSPASNNDFYGLLYDLLPKGKKRLEAKKYIDKELTRPLEKANIDYLREKKNLEHKWETIKGELKDTNPNLKINAASGIEVNVGGESYQLTNSQAVKVFNYIKIGSPQVFSQLANSGFSFEKLQEVADHVINTPGLYTYAKGITNVYSQAGNSINTKLNEHGRETFTKVKIDYQGLDTDTKELLGKVYGGRPDAYAPYTPVTAEPGKEGIDVEAALNTKEAGDYYSVMAGNLKKREGGGSMRIFGTNIDSDFDNYLRGPVRTQAFLDFARNASNFFGQEQFQGMKTAYGDAWADATKDSLKRIVSGRNTPIRQTRSTQMLSNWLNYTVGGIMFFNVRSALLQHISAANYLFDNPTTTVEGIKAMRSPSINKKIKDKLRNSPWLKERGKGRTDLVLDEIFDEQATNKAGRGIKYLQQEGYKLTKWGDKNAILRGGAPFMAGRYTELLKEGVQEEAALEQAYQEFVAKAEETQQSTRPERLGKEQTTQMGKLILAFANTPMQYNRIMSRAVKDLVGLRGVNTAEANKRKGQALRQIAYYGTIQNVMFNTLQKLTFASVGLDEKDEEERSLDFVNSLVNTILRGIGVWGALAASVKDAILAVSQDKPAVEALINTAPAIGTKVRHIRKALGDKAVYPDSQFMSDIESDYAKAIYRGAAAANAGVNLPLDRALKLAEQAADITASDLDLWEKALRLGGWDRYQLGESAGSALKRSDESGQAFRDGTIEVDPNLSPLEKEKTLLHEKQHLRDMKTNGLDYDEKNVYWKDRSYKRKNGKIEYNGEWLPEGDRSLPWEAAAYSAESPLKDIDPEETKYRDKAKARREKARQQTEQYGEKYGEAFVKPGRFGFRQQELHELKPQHDEHEGVAEGRQFTADWEFDPITQERFKTVGLTDRELARQATRQQLTQARPFEENEQEGEGHHGRYIGRKDQFAFDPDSDVLGSVTAHELGHGGFDLERGAWTKDIVGPVQIRDAFGNVSEGSTDYINDPQEVGGHLQQIRFDLGVKPGQKITKEMLKKVSDKHNLYLKGVRQSKKEAQLLKALNTVASVDKKRSLESLYNNSNTAIT